MFNFLCFRLPQRRMSVLLLNTKEDILNNVSNSIFFPYYGSQWVQLTGYWHYSKYFILCSAEERYSYRFETT